MEVWGQIAGELSRKDPRLAIYIRQIGPPTLSVERRPFNALCEAILSQQLAVSAARSIIAKFKSLAPPFPSPEYVLKSTLPNLRRAGVSGQKAVYLKSLAEHWRKPHWRRGWSRLSDEELVTRLIQVKGVGEWTAHMYLIFSLARPNVLPVGDYGVRQGVMKLYDLKRIPNPKEVSKHVAHWNGGYSVGAWYLWKAQDLKLL